MNKTSKTLFTFLLLFGTKGYSKEGLISTDVLKENKIDPVIVNLLLAEDVLRQSREIGFYKINEYKIKEILSKNSAPELVGFLAWLTSVMGEGTQVSEKVPHGMTVSSQDIKM